MPGATSATARNVSPPRKSVTFPAYQHVGILSPPPIDSLPLHHLQATLEAEQQRGQKIDALWGALVGSGDSACDVSAGPREPSPAPPPFLTPPTTDPTPRRPTTPSAPPAARLPTQPQLAHQASLRTARHFGSDDAGSQESGSAFAYSHRMEGRSQAGDSGAPPLGRAAGHRASVRSADVAAERAGALIAASTQERRVSVASSIRDGRADSVSVAESRSRVGGGVGVGAPALDRHGLSGRVEVMHQERYASDGALERAASARTDRSRERRASAAVLAASSRMGSAGEKSDQVAVGESAGARPAQRGDAADVVRRVDSLRSGVQHDYAVSEGEDSREPSPNPAGQPPLPPSSFRPSDRRGSAPTLLQARGTSFGAQRASAAAGPRRMSAPVLLGVLPQTVSGTSTFCVGRGARMSVALRHPDFHGVIPSGAVVHVTQVPGLEEGSPATVRVYRGGEAEPYDFDLQEHWAEPCGPPQAPVAVIPDEEWQRESFAGSGAESAAGSSFRAPLRSPRGRPPDLRTDMSFRARAVAASLPEGGGSREGSYRAGSGVSVGRGPERGAASDAASLVSACSWSAPQQASPPPPPRSQLGDRRVSGTSGASVMTAASSEAAASDSYDHIPNESQLTQPAPARAGSEGRLLSPQDDAVQSVAPTLQTAASSGRVTPAAAPAAQTATSGRVTPAAAPTASSGRVTPAAAPAAQTATSGRVTPAAAPTASSGRVTPVDARDAAQQLSVRALRRPPAASPRGLRTATSDSSPTACRDYAQPLRLSRPLARPPGSPAGPRRAVLRKAGILSPRDHDLISPVTVVSAAAPPPRPHSPYDGQTSVSVWARPEAEQPAESVQRTSPPRALPPPAASAGAIADGEAVAAGAEEAWARHPPCPAGSLGGLAAAVLPAVTLGASGAADFDAVVEEVAAVLPKESLPALTSFRLSRDKAREAATAAAAETAAMLGSDGPAMFEAEIGRAASAAFAAGNRRLLITGAADSGKTSVLRVSLARSVIPALSAQGQLEQTLLIPVRLASVLSGPPPHSATAVHGALTGIFVDSVCTQRPILRPWQSRLSRWLRRAGNGGADGTSSAPEMFADEHPSAAALLSRHAAALIHASRIGDPAEAFRLLFLLPDVLKDAFGFAGLLWVVDDVDRADDVAIGPGAPGVQFRMLQSVTAALSSSSAVGWLCTATARPLTRLVNALSPHATLSTQGIVPPEALLRHSSLPRTIRCCGWEYPIDIFGGCPGYLVPFIRLVQTESPSDTSARDGRSRCVEFFSEELSALFQSLAQLHGVGPR
eukprot:TRINITY_DN2625_c0_g1_i1.p1 TRINITY_DN2625_c0_g1~~TRINITY_DN2625_c0_g1_i1.p1  ORF type:complete len:1306 (+),score=240.74 TRINITY_DN2625_c0_g1_i1:62-3919(+)